jgi:hypothetical protein
MKAAARVGMVDAERGLWRSLPAALATEVGSLAVIALDLRTGLISAALALAAFTVAARSVGPREAALRPLLLVAGPPLRYTLVLAAAFVVWFPRGEGPLPALGCVFLLGLLVPILASGADALLARGRRRP